MRLVLYIKKLTLLKRTILCNLFILTFFSLFSSYFFRVDFDECCVTCPSIQRKIYKLKDAQIYFRRYIFMDLWKPEAKVIPPNEDFNDLEPICDGLMKLSDC